MSSRKATKVARAHRAARTAVRAVLREKASGVYRDTILAAAEAEFTSRGYAATKMVDVARRAGMSVGALYRHFDSKETIFVSLMERSGRDVLSRMRQTAAATRDPKRRIEALIATMLAFIEENRGMFLAFHTLGDADRAACQALVGQSENVRESIFAVYREALADGVARGVLRDDVALDDQLLFLTGATHGFLEAWARGGGEGRVVDKAPIIAHLTLCALGGHS